MADSDGDSDKKPDHDKDDKKPRGFDDAIRKQFLADIKDSSKNPTHDLAAAVHRLAEWAASGHLPKGCTYSDLKWMYERICEELHRRDPKSKAGGNFPALGSAHKSLDEIEMEQRCQALTSALKSAASPARSAETPVERFVREGKHYLTTEVRAVSLDPDKRTVDIAFSSEMPVPRHFGDEILDHSPGSVRLGRLNGGAPLLLNHDTGRQIGVVERAFVGDDRRGRATVRFSRSSLGKEILQDVQDGIRRLVSVGYRTHGEPRLEGENSYRFTDWEPLELSIVPVPADATVGVGRSEGFQPSLQPEVRSMPEGQEPEKGNGGEKVDVEAVRNEAKQAESERVRGIFGIAEKWGQRFPELKEKAQEYVDQNKPLDAFRQLFMDVAEKGGVIRAAKPEDLNVGLTEKQRKDFSFVRLINYLVSVREGVKPKAGQFEFDVVMAARQEAEKHGHAMPEHAIRIPEEVLGVRMGDFAREAIDALLKREVQVGGTGGELVATNLLAQDFIEILRNATPVLGLGPTVLPGLVGNIAIPRQSGAATTYWVAESVAPTESDQTFDQVTLSPKTLAANTKYSRKTLLQATPAIEGLVRSDLARVMGIELDRAAVNGSGAAGQPTGILQTAGIGSVVAAADSGNGGALAWGDIIAFIEALGKANALRGNLAFLSNAQVSASLRTTTKAGTYPVFIQEDVNELAGYKFAMSQNMPSNLTKGTGTGLSALLFGNWSDLLIGEWGGLDMIVDPYSFSSQGGVQITIFRDVDISVRHAVSFAADVAVIAA